MENDNQVILVSPHHDPDARLLNALKVNGPKLKAIFGENIRVSVSVETNKEVLSELKNLNITHDVTSKNLGETYRNAIKLGLNVNNAFILLADFDRALHWVNTYADELKELSNNINNKKGFVSLNRTNRALETHPIIQRTTEKVVNQMAFKLSGINVDIMSGGNGFSYDLAKTIVDEGKREDYGLYAEFLKIALEKKYEISCISVEGFEWETPDQFEKEINDMGFDNWLKSWETIEEWKQRIQIVNDSAQVLLESN